MSFVPDDTDRLAVNTLRTLSLDAVEKAASGHPGLPLGAAPMAYVLWQRHLVHDPSDPEWPDRDRFVLSAGHGSALLYSLMHLAGYPLSIEDLQSFRQWRSRTPGHPEYGLVPGIAATTGPLGQGAGIAVGMAIAERMLAARFNRPGHTIVDHRTYALVSDGDLMEGISGEASSLAGHLGLGKLVFLYDDNRVTLDGPADVSFTEDVGARYRAYNWQVIHVAHGDTDLAAIDAALDEARADESRPTLIAVRNTIGFGSPHRAGTSAAHGAPLGAEEVALTKRALGWDPALTFHVPEAARARFADSTRRGAGARRDWQERLTLYEKAEPGAAAELHAALARELPADWTRELPGYEPGEGLETRVAGGKAMNAIAKHVPFLVGGDADLSESTKTRIEGSDDFERSTPGGRNIRFGVREHAMGAITNGLLYHGGLLAFCGTFLSFSDYMREPIRLASLDHLPAIYVFTHDSIGLGEDGPTHQPVEQVAALRAIPGIRVVRPADANETVAAWRWAVERQAGPVALVLTRQKVPVLAGTRELARAGIDRGAYVLAEAEGGAPDAIVIATGSEVQLAVAARDLLAREGRRVRVVSMPCMEQFEAQSKADRDEVLPPSVTARVAVEAAASQPWYRWIGDRGRLVTVDRFGASAPGEIVLREYGFTAEHVVEAVRESLGIR